jgi:hypothetical protein
MLTAAKRRDTSCSIVLRPRVLRPTELDRDRVLKEKWRGKTIQDPRPEYCDHFGSPPALAAA